MKYRLLSKEQFEALHKEFATFLAAQEITKEDWELQKETHPKKVQKQLENFSDLVWEEVLGKTKYLDHFSSNNLNLFKIKDKSIARIVVRIEKEGIDLLQKKDFDWFIDHSNDPSINYFKGEKKYSSDRNKDIFKLIEQGAVLSEGKLFEGINQMLNAQKS